MISGKFDFVSPLEAGQRQMLRLLGTPDELERHVVYETGHYAPRNELIRDALDWLDRYLGPVKREVDALQVSR